MSGFGRTSWGRRCRGGGGSRARGRAPSRRDGHLADVALALGVERREVLALEPGEHLALRVLERAAARRASTRSPRERPSARGARRCRSRSSLRERRARRAIDVAELADVARPVVAHQALERVAGDALVRASSPRSLSMLRTSDAGCPRGARAARAARCGPARRGSKVARGTPPALTSRTRSRRVAAMTRTSTSRYEFEPPTRLDAPLGERAQELRLDVERAARRARRGRSCRRRPPRTATMRLSTAPVNAPRS